MGISINRRDESMESVLPGNNTSLSYKKLDYKLEPDGSVVMRLSMGPGSALFTLAGVLMALAFGVASAYFFLPKFFSPLTILVPFPFAVLCLILGFGLDEYYVASRSAGSFSVIKKRFGSTREQKLFSLDCLHCISVDYRTSGRIERPSPTYAVTLVKSDGQLLRVSDFLNYDRMQSINKRAETLAKLLGIPFVPGQEKMELSPKRTAQGDLEIRFGEN